MSAVCRSPPGAPPAISDRHNTGQDRSFTVQKRDNLEEIKCIFCGIESSLVVIEENGYQGKKCPQCGLIYVSPRPSFDEVVRLYGDGQAHISSESHISDAFQKRLYARHNLRLIRPVVKRGALLEIGAGAGYFLDEARKTGFHPFGLELNPVQAGFIRTELKIPCEESPLNPSVFEGKKFDVVYHCDVIGHFFDPIADFRNMNAIMKDGAFLVFETGNLGDVDKLYFKYFQRFQYPDHLFSFSTDSLSKLLDRTGFEVLKIYRYAILPQLILIKLSAGMRQRFFKPVRPQGSPGKTAGVQPSHKGSSVKRIIGPVWDYLNYILRYKIGAILPKKGRPQSLIVIAQKKKTPG
jgi:SAM-dependent methyltransferase